MNLPQNEFSPVDSLNSYTQHRGWYDHSVHSYYEIEKTTFIGAYSYHQLQGMDIFDERVTNLPRDLLQKTQIMCVPEHSQEDFLRIFSAVIAPE